jgi:hypothetical protein
MKMNIINDVTKEEEGNMSFQQYITYQKAKNLYANQNTEKKIHK